MVKKFKNIAGRYLSGKCNDVHVISDLSNLIANTYEISIRDVTYHLEQYFDNHSLFIEARNNGKAGRAIIKKLKEGTNYTLYRNGLEPVFKMKIAPFSSVYTGYRSRPSITHVVREVNLSAVL